MIWRHLVGEYSLARSYWCHTVLLGWGLAFAGGWALSALADRSSAASVWVAANSVSAVPHPWQEPMAARLVRTANEGFRASLQGGAARGRSGVDSRHGVTI